MLTTQALAPAHPDITFVKVDVDDASVGSLFIFCGSINFQGYRRRVRNLRDADLQGLPQRQGGDIATFAPNLC